MRNRYIGYAIAEMEEYMHFAGLEDTLAPAGVLGPVEIGRE